VPAAGSIHNDVLADAQIGYGGRVEMVNLTNFGETYTDNIGIHTVNYTVSKIQEPETASNRRPGKNIENFCVFGVLWRTLADLTHSYNFLL
jgi:hypothetical protein